MDDYKDLYFEELKEGNELRQKLKGSEKALSTLKSTFWITLYTILCIFLTYTHKNITDTIIKLFGCLLMLIPFSFIYFISSFVLADFKKFSKKGKFLTTSAILIAIPVIVYLAITIHQ
ncbi:MAG: hypothetical protein IJE46_06845 [Clostridia bacterium]|nr:hypothetical protein [Clostridia bacterium]